MVAPDGLATLMDTLAWLADPEHAPEIAESEAAITTGDTLSLDEVCQQLAARPLV